MRSAKLTAVGDASKGASRRRRTSCLVGAAVAALALASPSEARADDSSRANLDFGKLAEAIQDGGRSLFPREGYGMRPTVAARAEQSFDRWFGITPHLSLVARDWGGVQPLLGGHLAVTDQFRLSRSSRMVVTRVRLADGRVSPFVQVGLGQWRVDTDLMPVLPRDTELATQLGVGCELHVFRQWRLAIEVDHTVLYREAHEPQQLSGPHIWGAFLATHARF